MFQRISAYFLLFFLASCYGERYSELMSASSLGDKEAVLRMLLRGAKVNETNKQGKSALILAAAGGHAEVIRVLVSNGAEVNEQDINGTTALIAAATANHLDAVKTLLEQGADPSIHDSNDGSALVNAVFFNFRDVSSMLLKVAENIPKKDLEEALLLASGLGNADIVEDILRKGVDVNAKGHKGRTPLMAAVYFDKVNTAELLINRGADSKTSNSDGETAFSIASEKGNKEILSLMENKSVESKKVKSKKNKSHSAKSEKSK